MLVLQKGLILPVPMYGGSYFFIQPIFCELNSSRHIQFHYYLISSEPDNFLSYHNLYGFHHLHTEYSCCLHIR